MIHFTLCIQTEGLKLLYQIQTKKTSTIGNVDSEKKSTTTYVMLVSKDQTLFFVSA